MQPIAMTPLYCIMASRSARKPAAWNTAGSASSHNALNRTSIPRNARLMFRIVF